MVGESCAEVTALLFAKGGQSGIGHAMVRYCEIMDGLGESELAGEVSGIKTNLGMADEVHGSSHTWES